MGNAGSTTMHRERHKSSDLSTPNSPANFRDSITRANAVTGNAATAGVNAISAVGAVGGNDVGGQAFIFDKKQNTVLYGGSSQDDEEQPYYTKQVGSAAAATTAAAAAAVITTANPATADSTPAARKRLNTVSAHNSESNMSTKDTPNDITRKDAEDDMVESIDQETTKTALPTVLRWDGGGKNVMISGTFSKWKPIPMVRSHGNFVTIIDLPEGDHQYKFCVDGEWKVDPKLKSVDNDFGEKNNLVSVRASDFEVFQALAKDSENVPNYAEKEYSQEVPTAKPWEKVSGPPVLPPHLLQVILNKDTPLSCEPTLLPEPNHVMLNHLYALSIKDGVMVLSATHRYRKKYVTTLLYKPI